ncbi:MAG TPA: RNA 2',3'-cyclic phosphodiesterase [Bacillus sp. (in: firmicutes)]|nr:RNA 2',3'-cyclic phosphodiesterase [Bacillus sp. (in: firmicutes)]
MTQDPHYFIGLSIPKDIQDFLFSWRKRSEEVLPFKTWVGNGDYHITLQFLGSTSKQQKESLVENLMAASSDHQGFDLQLSASLQEFGKPESPRVLWLGVNESLPLASLQADIASRCRHLGFRVDQRPYRPHITIAKQWRGTAFPSEIYRDDSIVPKQQSLFHVNRFSLFQIHLNRVSRYEPVHTFELQRKEEK